MRNLEDRYLEEEKERGTSHSLVRLLGLIFLSLRTTTTLGSLRFAGRDWPVSAIMGMWSRYLVAPTRIDKARVGLVICTRVRPPEDSGGEVDWNR